MTFPLFFIFFLLGFGWEWECGTLGFLGYVCVCFFFGLLGEVVFLFGLVFFFFKYIEFLI